MRASTAVEVLHVNWQECCKYQCRWTVCYFLVQHVYLYYFLYNWGILQGLVQSQLHQNILLRKLILETNQLYSWTQLQVVHSVASSTDYFRNVNTVWRHSVNVIPFTPKEKCNLPCADFHETHITQYIYDHNTHRILLNPWRKFYKIWGDFYLRPFLSEAWVSPHQYSRNS